MKLRDMRVKLTTIAVGDDVDGAMLLRIAQIGNGTAYSANNPLALPQIFLKAVRVVRSPLIREGDFTPVVLASGSGMSAGLRDIPALSGLVLTRPRKDPTVTLAMAAPTGEPVLAHWNVGLGQVVAFTSDAHAWARNWLDWPGYERMWTQLVRVASRPPANGGVLATITERSGQLIIRSEAADATGLPRMGLSMPTTVYAPSGAAKELTLVATGPGTYEATLPAEESGSYIALVKPRDGAGVRLAPALAGSTVQEGAEYRTLTSNKELLERIAAKTSGRVLDARFPQNANVFDRTGIPPAEAIQRLWQQCLLLAIVVLMLDIANRRIAWDRFTSGAFGARAALVGSRGAAAVAGLRQALEAASGPATAVPSIALGETQAKELAMAARDRRRQQRLAGLGSATPPGAQPSRPSAEISDATDRATSPEGGGLLAAKRRAAQRFDDERASS
jgi:Ca-activated chloride channel homolog